MDEDASSETVLDKELQESTARAGKSSQLKAQQQQQQPLREPSPEELQLEESMRYTLFDSMGNSVFLAKHRWVWTKFASGHSQLL